jgi:hypothetical protein
MSKSKLLDLIKELKELDKTPLEFNQRERTDRAARAGVLMNQIFYLYKRLRDYEERVLWQEAAEVFHRVINEAYPSGFEEDFRHLLSGSKEGLEGAIAFLEFDPWFFRTGYLKAELIRLVCKLPLSDDESQRLEMVVINAIDLRDRREFRWYCKLAKKINSSTLRKKVEERLLSSDKSVCRRSRWVLSAISDRQSDT